MQSASCPASPPAGTAPPPIGIARRDGLAFVARFADSPRRWHPEHFVIALVWLGSVALGLWRIHSGW